MLVNADVRRPEYPIFDHAHTWRMPKPADPLPNPRDALAQFISQSPFVTKLGITAEILDTERVRLNLRWDESNTSMADMIHGGAIASLADLTVMAAAWCGASAPETRRAVTVSLALDYVAPARATDLVGEGRALRRGRSLVNCEAEILCPGGELVAKAIATCKIG